MKYEEITEKVLSAFYKVYNTLGYGFLERVYTNALNIELENMGLSVEMEQKIVVYYYDKVVGYYKADMLVENLIIVECKANSTLAEENEYQLLNYLKATNIEVGLLLNFGSKPQVKRKLFDNTKKDFAGW
jgi:GxxExxY protein